MEVKHKGTADRVVGVVAAAQAGVAEAKGAAAAEEEEEEEEVRRSVWVTVSGHSVKMFIFQCNRYLFYLFSRHTLNMIYERVVSSHLHCGGPAAVPLSGHVPLVHSLPNSSRALVKNRVHE